MLFSACDCNLRGTRCPSCDPDTGECLCRTGVTGASCDECVAGYGPSFPDCEQCHPCNDLWAEHVTDVQRAARTMRTLIPDHSMAPPPAGYQQWLLDMNFLLGGLANLTGASGTKMEAVEQLCVRLRYGKR